jgi:hypothetical protein
MKVKQTDIAWAGGFFDGEGSSVCRINNGNPFSIMQITLGQKDYKGSIAPTLIRFQEILGVGKIYRKTLTGKEIDMHQFYVCKFVDVQRTIKLLWNYISEPKKQQFIRNAKLLKQYSGKDILK